MNVTAEKIENVQIEQKSIIVTPCYYGGTCNAPQQHLMRNAEALSSLEDDPVNGSDTDYGNLPGAFDIWVGSEADAEKIIDALTDGTYYLSHGEAGRPGYEICDADYPLADLGDDCVDSSGAFGGGWTEVDGDNLPEGVQSKLDAENVDWSSSEDDHDIYTAVITVGSQRYGIAFAPTSLAIQTNCDDLSSIDWAHATYYTED